MSVPPRSIVPAVLLALCGCALGAAPLNEVEQARWEGWHFATITIEILRRSDNAQFPGIRAWLEDYGRIEKKVADAKQDAPLPSFDEVRLVSRNPNFWRMTYEIAPGDPALALLHSGLLLAAAEAQRASHIAAFARQRPGIDDIMHQALTSVAISAMAAQKRSHELVQEGVTLHDAGDFKGALNKYDEALIVMPTNGWAHYERGFTLRIRALKESGQPLPADDTVTLGKPVKDPPEVQEAFARARAHDPFQFHAWQGSDPAVIRGARALIVKAAPVWEEIRKGVSSSVSDEKLADLTEACREARIDDYALVLRQIMIARRRGYEAVDHPFIAECLRRLAPGEATQAVIVKLRGESFPARQLAPIKNEAEMRTAPAESQPSPK